MDATAGAAGEQVGEEVGEEEVGDATAGAAGEQVGEEEVGVVQAAVVAVMGALVVAALRPLGPLEGRGPPAPQAVEIR